MKLKMDNLLNELSTVTDRQIDITHNTSESTWKNKDGKVIFKRVYEKDFGDISYYINDGTFKQITDNKYITFIEKLENKIDEIKYENFKQSSRKFEQIIADRKISITKMKELYANFPAVEKHFSYPNGEQQHYFEKCQRKMEQIGDAINAYEAELNNQNTQPNNNQPNNNQPNNNQPNNNQPNNNQPNANPQNNNRSAFRRGARRVRRIYRIVKRTVKLGVSAGVLIAIVTMAAKWKASKFTYENSNDKTIEQNALIIDKKLKQISGISDLDELNIPQVTFEQVWQALEANEGLTGREKETIKYFLASLEERLPQVDLRVLYLNLTNGLEVTKVGELTDASNDAIAKYDIKENEIEILNGQYSDEVMYHELCHVLDNSYDEEVYINGEEIALQYLSTGRKSGSQKREEAMAALLTDYLLSDNWQTYFTEIEQSAEPYPEISQEEYHLIQYAQSTILDYLNGYDDRYQMAVNSINESLGLIDPNQSIDSKKDLNSFKDQLIYLRAEQEILNGVGEETFVNNVEMLDSEKVKELYSEASQNIQKR